jgi:hypothetical protein
MEHILKVLSPELFQGIAPKYQSATLMVPRKLVNCLVTRFIYLQRAHEKLMADSTTAVF